MVQMSYALPMVVGKCAEACPGGRRTGLSLQASCFSQGIEMKFKNKLFPLIVCPAWIPELNSVEHGRDGKERVT